MCFLCGLFICAKPRDPFISPVYVILFDISFVISCAYSSMVTKDFSFECRGQVEEVVVEDEDEDEEDDDEDDDDDDKGKLL